MRSARDARALELRVLLAEVADGVEEAVDVENEGDEHAQHQRASCATSEPP